MSDILNLEPKRVWYYFNEICRIPHCSFNEAGLRDYIGDLAKSLGLETRIDKGGNIVVRKPANGKGVTDKTLVFQGHLDMVCEATPGSNVDFKKDPIKPRIVDGEWIMAEGTSLGADNGIGLAFALAVMESKDIPHGPLEFLFTVGEEPGLFGAAELEPDMIKGRTLINMDSEEDGMLYIGCAGAFNSRITIPIKRIPLPQNFEGLEIEVAGLRSGHSGVVIHEGRGNALKILARILTRLNDSVNISINNVYIDKQYNVIPEAAKATIAVSSDKKKETEDLIKKISTEIKEELKTVEPGLWIEAKGQKVSDVIEKTASDKIICAMDLLPYGIDVMSPDIDRLVQTSSNCAATKTTEDTCILETSSRSSSATQQESMKLRPRAIAELIGGKIEFFGEYPGWLPNVSSNILKIMKNTHSELFGKEALVLAIHAGLECGFIGGKIPGMDMISFGPWLENVHSVKERMNIKSVQKSWKWLLATVETFARS